MSMEELKQKLAPVHKKLNENLEKQQALLEEYESLLQESIELTDAYFQQVKAVFLSSKDTEGKKP